MMNMAQPAKAGLERKGDMAPLTRKIAFNKPHLEPEALLEKLRGQGMEVTPETAMPYLRQVGGYRMKGYWYQWQDPITKQFRPGTHFDQIIYRYEFDRELRRITSDALERIELMARATISNVLSKHEGPHWFMKEGIFLKQIPGRDPPITTLLDKICEEVRRVKGSQFIEHYLSKYNDPALPPSWAVSECLSFGSWSHAFSYLSNISYKKEISRRFGVEDATVFASWLHAFSVLRNKVAHHSRLLGAKTGVSPREYVKRGLTFDQSVRQTFYSIASAINFVCEHIPRDSHWRTTLEDLFKRYPDIPIGNTLGFPKAWQDGPGWGNRNNPQGNTTMAHAFQAAQARPSNSFLSNP